MLFIIGLIKLIFLKPSQPNSNLILFFIAFIAVVIIFLLTHRNNYLTKAFPNSNLPALSFIFSWAVFVVLVSSIRGFANIDESFILSAAYRISQGEVPYRDFFYNVTPLTIYFQAVIFKIFGFNLIFTKYYIAIVNGVFSVLIFWLLNRWLGTRLALFLALISSVWFYSILGTPWYDQDSYLMILLGIVFLTSYFFTHKNEKLKLLTAGIFFGLSFLGKQNLGLVSIILGSLVTYGFVYYKDRKIINFKILIFALGVFFPIGLLRACRPISLVASLCL